MPNLVVLFSTFRDRRPVLHMFAPLTVVFCLFGASERSFAQTAPRRTLSGHVPPPVRTEQPIGRFDVTNQMHLAIGLPLRNQAELGELLHELYDPGSTNFHKFLTPQEFTERFGPTEQDYRAVREFAETNGLEVTGTIGSRLVLDVEGLAGNVEQAFQITMRTYRHPTEPRDFVAPDREPSVPATLPVADIGGLGDFSRPHSLFHREKAPVRPLAGSGASGNYGGSDFRNAYVPGVTLNGAGQKIGLLEFDGYNARDINNYESLFSTTLQTGLTNVLIDSYNGSAGSANDEVCLDIEMCISMAPNLSQIIVYEGNPSKFSFNPVDVVTRIANDNLARQLSSSWTWSGGPDATIDAAFVQMATQGQSYFQAAGDSDAYTGSQPLDDPGQVNSPVGNTNITVVGGTALTSGAGASYISENVWNENSTNSNEGTGGGVSTVYAIPPWQKTVNMSANMGSTTMRNVPDVALLAYQVIAVFTSGHNSVEASGAGTSCAAPLWAAFTSLVNQQNALSGSPPAGFLNPAIYGIGTNANYTNCFHDITVGNNAGANTAGLYPATTGYDLCTGWGTPNGTNLINALAPRPYIIQQPASATVTNGNNVTLSVVVGGQAPFSYQWFLNSTNLVAGGTVSGISSRVLSFTPITANYAGSYKVVVTNSSGAVTSSVATLTVTTVAPPVANFTAGPTVGVAPLTVNFTNASTGATSYSWSFGDGNISTSVNPVDTYSNAGTYTVTLTAVGAGGTNTVTQMNYIVVTNPPPPTVSFTSSPTSGLVPLTVNFANTSSGATNYSWNFGDGNLSSAVNPAHAYTSAGNYTVTLTAVGAGGTNSLTLTNYIVVTNPPPPIVSFTGGPTNGLAPVTVNFTNATSGATNYSWNFGDGNASTAVNPSNIYTNAGSYSVTLTAIGAGGTNSLMVTNYILVTNPPPPVVVFSGSPTNGAAPLTVSFTNSSAGATNYSWNFGDGNSSGVINPANTYTNAGTYSVTLTAVGAGGTNSLTLANYIVVTNPPPVAAFVAFPTNGGAPLTVFFTNLSVGATNYSWDFGDGQTNTAASPTNIYQSEGSYTVTLTAFGPGGQSTLVESNYIVLSNSPPVLAPIANDTVHPGMTVMFTNSAGDPDADQSLTFSLDPGAPPSASIDPASGVFTWTPDSSYANTTDPITVRVTDNGVPPLSATQMFNVTVVPLVFQPASLSNGVLTISWGSIPGVTYQVQYTTNLADPNWTELPPDVTASDVTASTTDVIGTDVQRFYRVVVGP